MHGGNRWFRAEWFNLIWWCRARCKFYYLSVIIDITIYYHCVWDHLTALDHWYCACIRTSRTGYRSHSFFIMKYADCTLRIHWICSDKGERSFCSHLNWIKWNYCRKTTIQYQHRYVYDMCIYYGVLFVHNNCCIPNYHY